MDAMEMLLGRRSIRKYQDTPIPKAELETVLEAATYAPSAVNLQHWYFVAVQGEERMAELRELMCRVTEKFHPVLSARFANHPQEVTRTERFLTSLGGAPVCVLAFFFKDNYPDRDGAMQSVSAAVENLLLAAWAREIGSCWMTAPLRMGFGEEIRQKYAPDKGEFVAAITLGYPAETADCPPRKEGRYTIL